jgi:hypothetical protein
VSKANEPFAIKMNEMVGYPLKEES